MAEPFQESWHLVEEPASCCHHQSGHRPKRAPVIEILMWLDCCATLVAVLCTRYVQFATEFIREDHSEGCQRHMPGYLRRPSLGIGRGLIWIKTDHS